jgi:hypothetical protein
MQCQGAARSTGVLATKRHKMTRKNTRAAWDPNPQSVPNGSYRVILCLFVAKTIRGLSPSEPALRSLFRRCGFVDDVEADFPVLARTAGEDVEVFGDPFDLQRAAALWHYVKVGPRSFRNVASSPQSVRFGSGRGAIRSPGPALGRRRSNCIATNARVPSTAPSVKYRTRQRRTVDRGSLPPACITR